MSDARQTPPSFDEMVALIEMNFIAYSRETKLFTPEQIEKGWQRYKTLNHLYHDEVQASESAGASAVWVKGEYDRMYDQVKRGIRTVCYVDYKWSKDDPTPCRDICTIRADHMELSARGIGYGYPRSRFHKEFDEKESFIEMCKNSNVEWLDESPSLSPDQSGKEVVLSFMDWAYKNGYWHSSRDQWMKGHLDDTYTTSQLYDIYKQNKYR